ncbi:MAG: tRNA (adenosine(37)-N6)-dimethylallyltransferase MiaA [Planctomycetes bacterium]|nr:tRNA (adenosine(37)-N6)-dimethylallyltransferase MiaA [Planctomycetota bacterium]MCC7396069.1 tRNA (adenosine(37)-N6)-dimethylallyltransferase MiaA [Planctomycetota bacterium]
MSPPSAAASELWVVTGPTASGKTHLAVALAQALDLEILSMDSMAVYRQMDIGTAKPSAAERAAVPHHLIDLVSPQETFDTARWCNEAAKVLAEVSARGRRALFVGGTPLYLMAFFKGLMEGPEADPELRAGLEAREDATPGCLHEELSRRDPEAAQRIHRNDRRRLVRALEVLERTGQPISKSQQHFAREGWLRPCRLVGIGRDRDDLHARVKLRTELMLAAGLLEETAAIEQSGGFSPTSGAAIGYAECRDFLRGRYKDHAELRNRIRRNTHRLIRRQTTWLRRLREVRWLPPDSDVAALRAAFGG